MSTSTATIEPVSADPIDALVPPPQPRWVRLITAVMIVLAVGLLGYAWQFGVIRPAPDCCGSSGSSVPIGRSNEDDAVTVVVSFFNSSPRSIDVNGASADLPGATVADIAPYPDDTSWSLPPERLIEFPVTVAAHSDLLLAVTFSPEQCNTITGPDGWGEVQLDLAVGGDPGYPTFGRTFDIAVRNTGHDELLVFPPEQLDDVVFETANPLSVACVLLGD